MLFGLLATAAVVSLIACAGAQPKKKFRKTCSECHPEYKQKYSQGVVHQPVKEQKCGTCHRTHGLIGGANLRNVQPALCFKCHRKLERDLGKLATQHAPVKNGKCGSCHDPHNSPNQAMLLKARGELCFDCHDRQLLKGTYVHKPVAENCATCHPAHGSAAAGLLTQPADTLCATCHKVDSGQFVELHLGFPVAGNCLGCHNVHASDNRALLRSHVHQPVAQKGCSECHTAPSGGRPPALKQSGADLCFRCHSEQRGAFAQVGTHSPVADGDCAACHASHASDYTGMIKTAPQKLCFECHQFKSFGPDAEFAGRGFVHAPAAEGDCQSCHRPHRAAAGQSSLLSGPIDALCRDCHGDVVDPRRYGHPPVDDEGCLTCHQSHESVHEGLLIKEQKLVCIDCHDQILDELGKASLHRPFSRGRCSGCHDPHGSDNRHILVADANDTCAACHQDLEAERQLNTAHKPFRDGQCDRCHMPHASDELFLLSGEPSSLCLDCHSAMRPRVDVPPAHQNCSTCHAPHGNAGDHYLRQSLPGLCLSCHEVNAYWDKGAAHAPARDGECQSCHDSHFVDTDRVVGRDWTAALCSPCHETDPSVLASSHKGIAPGNDSCRNCHDPHGGPDRSLTFPVQHHPFAEGDCTPCHPGGRP